jgi:hypothetical protein
MKPYKGRRSKAPLILSLSIDGGEWSVSRPGRFTTGNEPLYPWDKRLGGPQRQSGCFEEEKNCFAPVGIRTPNLPARSLVSMLTTLSRFLKIIFYVFFIFTLGPRDADFYDNSVLTTGAHRTSCSWVMKVTFKVRLVSRYTGIVRGVLPVFSYSPSARDN